MVNVPDNNQKMFKNPILPGFYPDPSICRVDTDYYLVTSSFAYFPGIPIFHSNDLVNWKQIGHVLDRVSQLNLDGLGHSDGIYAPTIRYHEGTFYLTTTNVYGGGNFIVTAPDPCGPWSDPIWLPEAPGIDPSLFFDHDGRCYFLGTRPAPEGERYFGNYDIWLQELDLQSMTLIGEKYSLWRGALKDVCWPEGPHLYFKDGWYYLMIAEGGTDYFHAVTIARSQKITGPYEGNRANPILTHRHLGREYPIVNVGHADLVETQNGEWWMVVLGSRPYGGYYRNLGRETFLAPVVWEDGWPVVSPGTGRVEFNYVVPNLPESKKNEEPSRDDFNKEQLALYWNFLRTPRECFWSLTERPGWLRIKLKPEKLTDLANPAFIGRRQQHMNFTVNTLLEFVPASEGEVAGLVLLQSNKYQYRYEFTTIDGKGRLRLIRCCDGIEDELAAKEVNCNQLIMRIVAKGQNYSFYYCVPNEAVATLIEDVDGRILSTDVAGGFVGTYIGLFGTSNNRLTTNYVDFDWFEYTGED
ncbi:MAG TPA: glycoside hydrolase family 43 protein [Bacillota bacterium]|nr:glycoside hydrolase family 43 protein [Bacillota bacterium]HOL09271.1 glycoside hydrolase family 43 protein [Bacillota bacterium]HPO96934.1 glycoside hydrolase family 43 protein [Bacillota bacterium]